MKMQLHRKGEEGGSSTCPAMLPESVSGCAHRHPTPPPLPVSFLCSLPPSFFLPFESCCYCVGAKSTAKCAVTGFQVGMTPRCDSVDVAHTSCCLNIIRVVWLDGWSSTFVLLLPAFFSPWRKVWRGRQETGRWCGFHLCLFPPIPNANIWRSRLFGCQGGGRLPSQSLASLQPSKTL